MSRPSVPVPDWHGLIRASVRECVRTWQIQGQRGPVTPEAFEAIVARTVVLLMQRLEGAAPHLIMALVPGLLHTMLETFLEVLAEEARESGQP